MNFIYPKTNDNLDRAAGIEPTLFTITLLVNELRSLLQNNLSLKAGANIQCLFYPSQIKMKNILPFF